MHPVHLRTMKNRWHCHNDGINDRTEAGWSWLDPYGVRHICCAMAHSQPNGEPYYQPLCQRLVGHLKLIDKLNRPITCIACLSVT